MGAALAAALFVGGSMLRDALSTDTRQSRIVSDAFYLRDSGLQDSGRERK